MLVKDKKKFRNAIRHDVTNTVAYFGGIFSFFPISTVLEDLPCCTWQICGQPVSLRNHQAWEKNQSWTNDI